MRSYWHCPFLSGTETLSLARGHGCFWGGSPMGSRALGWGPPPRALVGSPHYQTCAGTPSWSGSSSQPAPPSPIVPRLVTSAHPLCPEGGVVGLPGTPPRRAGLAVGSLGPGLLRGPGVAFTPPGRIVLLPPAPPRGDLAPRCPGWGCLSSGSSAFPARQPLGGHLCSVKRLSLVPVWAEAAQAGRLVPWQGRAGLRCPALAELCASPCGLRPRCGDVSHR